jgi:uncharacterized protein
MRDTLRRDLAVALKARDRVAISALRSTLAAIDNAEALPAGPPAPGAVGSEHVAGSVAGLGAAEVERRQLTEHDVRGVVQAEMHERAAAALGYEQVGRTDLAQRLRSEAEVLSRYLPPAR